MWLLALDRIFHKDIARLIVWLLAPVLSQCILVAFQAASGNKYVDARICATCHTRIAANYAQTGMGRSVSRPGRADALEDYAAKNELYHDLSDTHYSMLVRDGSYYQRRWQISSDGKETNVEELKIDYVLGSGNHARSYLHRTPRGTLIELPLGWYSEKGGYWGMGPGFDSLHPATRRLISYECIFCHDAYPRIPAGHAAPGSEPVFAGDLPEGIDCQRCHGPGGNHVETAHAAGSKREQILASIVNPAHLSPRLRMDLCMQCHLEPTSAAIPSLVRRFDRGPFSFVAGEPLSSFVLAFDHAPGTGHEDKFEIVGSSAYRLRQSRCFLKSKDTMTCETCHDPHRSSRGDDAAHYSNACRQCHGAGIADLVSKGRHPAAEDCVSCHMPKRRTDDVVHAIMTDHLIQRRPPARDLLAERRERHPAPAEEYRAEVVPYYPATLAAQGEDAMYKALAQVAMKNNLARGVVELDRLVTAQNPREAEWYLQLGNAWLAAAEPAKALSAYERAIRLLPGNVRALQSIARAWKAAEQSARSADSLRQALRLNPSDGGSWYQSAMLAFEMGRNGEALQQIEQAIAIDPDLPGEYTILARIQMAAGREDAAERTLREALHVDPYDSSAWDLAGRVNADKRQFAEALNDFEKAIRYRPDFAPHLYDYALALANSSDFERAQKIARQAARADPELAEVHLLMGGLLARKRLLPEAAKEYQTALRLRPDFSRARLDLASVLVQQGDRQGAMQQLHEAARSSDPEVVRTATTALQRLGER